MDLDSILVRMLSSKLETGALHFFLATLELAAAVAKMPAEENPESRWQRQAMDERTRLMLHSVRSSLEF